MDVNDSPSPASLILLPIAMQKIKVSLIGIHFHFFYLDASICVLTGESRLYCLRRVIDI